MPEQIRYRWSDVWLLMAILYADGGEGAELTYIIATGDAINKAIFTDSELHSGFARLAAGGLVREKASRFHATAKARDHFREAERAGTELRTVWDELDRILNAAAWEPGDSMPHPDDTLTYPGLTPEMIGEAVERYRKDFHKLWAEMRGGKRKKKKK